jgi:hypothetical protein
MSMRAIGRGLPAGSVLVLSLLAVPPASGQPATDSCLWRNSVVKVYHADVGRTWRVGRAIRIWNVVDQGQPRLQTVTTEATADVVVSPYHRYATNMNGWTLNYCDRDHITRSTVRLNAARPISQDDRAKVAVHELGHVLGLRHRPYLPHQSLMYPSLWGCVAYPTLLDRRTLGSIY